jgi:hypothetical protein
MVKAIASTNMPKLELLSDYELGRLIALIEWVVRGAKPIADCGSRYLNEQQREYLRHDLETAIELSGEQTVSAYILPHAVDSSLYEYGVFVHDWALQARIYIEEHESPDWLQGFVFGYSVNAIQAFITALPLAQESRLQQCDDRGRAEIVRLY